MHPKENARCLPSPLASVPSVQPIARGIGQPLEPASRRESPPVGFDLSAPEIRELQTTGGTKGGHLKGRQLNLDGRKRAFKNGHARVETRVLKTLAYRNGF